MADNPADHQLPKQFIHEGVYWNMQTNRETLEKVKTYPLTKDDLIVTSYPKAGTTWLQEIVWQVMHDGKTEDSDLQQRIPYLELNIEGAQNTMSILKPGPKMLKTHLPFSYYQKQITEDKLKVIIVIRNIKDNLVSFYHFYRMNKMMGQFKGTWDQFFTFFKEKRLFNGDWLEFNLSWWRQRHLPNILVVFYEEMKANPKAEIQKIAKFCGKDHPDAIIDSIVQKTSFKSMSTNTATNYSQFGQFLDMSVSKFMRKGEVGDWVNYFTPEQSAYIEKHYEPTIKAEGMRIKYEI